MSAHTPGPWAYEPTSGAIYYADNDVEPCIAGINQDSVSVEQSDADGYLMAAAPDMFAAAIALEAALQEYVNTGFTGLAFHNVTNCRADLRAAVAKARGE